MPDQHAFISYSRRDESFARQVLEHLQREGIDVWMDQTSIRPGQSYSEEIAHAIRDSKALVLVYTEHANQSPEIHKEVQLAANRRVPIIPLRLSDSPYHAALEYHLAAAQWIDATRSTDDALTALVAHLLGTAGGKGNPLPPLPSAGIPERTTAGKRRTAAMVGALGAVAALAGWLGFSEGLDNDALRQPAASATAPVADPEASSDPTTISGVNPAVIQAPSGPEVYPEPSGPRVAVLYFDFGGGDDRLVGLRKGLADMLVSDLRGSGLVNVVERERLEEILAELNLQRTAAVDQSTAVRIGRLLGAEMLVFGSFFELFGTLRMDAKLVRVETGQVLASEGVDGQMQDFPRLKGQLADRLLEGIAGKGGPAAAPRGLEADEVIAYSAVLDAIDQGRVEEARVLLAQFRETHPDFLPAQRLAIR
jgi:TolB-like protein